MENKKHDLRDFPTLEKAKQAVDILNTYKFPLFSKEDSPNEFSKLVTNKIRDEFGILLYGVQPHKLKSMTLPFFRVRELDSFNNINLISEHAYPPSNVVGMGRCNFPKFPVFYCSNSPMIALTEVIREYDSSNRKYCLSKWEVIPSEEEFFFQHIFPPNTPEENIFRRIHTSMLERIGEPFEGELPDDLKEGLKEQITYIGKQFIEDRSYSISASLAHYSLYAEHNLATDILMYPSVQSVLKGSNMAVHPNFVDNNMCLKRLYVVQVNNYKQGEKQMNITFLNYAKVVKNKILWYSINPPNEEFQGFLKEDFDFSS